MQLHPSPMIVAANLLQINLGGLTVEELMAHADELRDALLGLVNEQLSGRPTSPMAAANIRTLLAKLQARLSAVLDLIEDRRQAASGAVETEGSPPRMQP